METDDFIHEISTGADPRQLWAVTTRWLAGFGLDRVIHLRQSVPGSAAHVRTTMGGAFERYYAEQSFFRDDPFLKYCVPSWAPVATGAEYLGSYGYLTERETELIATAAEVGFQAGFSAVVQNRGGQIEAWNLGAAMRRSEIEALRRTHEHEIRLGLLALRDRLAWDEAGCTPLSPRERQCMELLCAGHRLKSVAAELGLALVTVDMHLRNARRKLGAQTRDQAIALYLERPRPHR